MLLKRSRHFVVIVVDSDAAPGSISTVESPATDPPANTTHDGCMPSHLLALANHTRHAPVVFKHSGALWCGTDKWWYDSTETNNRLWNGSETNKGVCKCSTDGNPVVTVTVTIHS